jgi:site-specific DNA recombinase
MSVAAIYARYSSDLQREASIEDQIRICRERAAKGPTRASDDRFRNPRPRRKAAR